MFNTFLKRKIVLIGVALLIVGAGVFILSRSGSFNGGFTLVAQAWQTAFGGFGSGGSAMDLPLPPSSTISDTLGQENASLGEPADWPSLLIDKKTAPKPSVALQSAVSNAVAALDLASSSSALDSETSAPTSPQWCDFTGTEQGDPGIIFNEVAWMGSTQSANDEWLELKNISGLDVNVGGWQVLNRSGSIKINIGAANPMAPESFLLLERDKDYSGALVNSGDWLKVFNRDCKIVDDMDFSNGWPAGDNAMKKTLERDVSVNGWHTSVNVGGSPGAQNSVIPIYTSPTSSVETIIAVTTTNATSTPAQNIPLATSTPTSTQVISPPVVTTTPAIIHLVIAVVQITGGAGVTDQDYIKIFNPTAESIDVSGWKLRKRTQSGTESSIKVFPNGSAIIPGDYFIWANSADGFAVAIGANVSSTQTLASDNSITLIDASDTLVDALAWGSGHIGPYIEGSAYPENPTANQQLARKFEAGVIKDTQNNLTDFGLLTPPGTSI